IFCIYLTIYKLQQIKYRFWLAGLLLMIAVFGSAYIRFQIDLTQEKRFTLSKSTIQLLHHVDSTIRVEVLLAGKLPADYKKLAIATENMLA
ncbi:Gldg family protein, partial [Acinetobacter baumannii]